MSESKSSHGFFHRLETYILVFLGVAATLLMFVNALGRYIFGSTLVWAEEVIRMLFVWAMFIAITTSFLRNEHIGFDGLAKRGGFLGLVSSLVCSVCLIGVGGILAFFGYRYNALTGDVPLTATNLPTSLFMWPGIIAGAAWVVIGFVRLTKIRTGRSGRNIQ